MKITSLDVTPLQNRGMLLQVHTDEGIVGWGETQCALVPDIVAQLVRQLVAPGLIGEWPTLVQTLIYVVLGLVWLLPLRRFLIWMETGRWS